MQWSRLAVLAALALSACKDNQENPPASAGAASPAVPPAASAAAYPAAVIAMPPNINNTANRQAVLDAVSALNLSDADFEMTNGADAVDVGANVGKNPARIEPHKGSQNGGFVSGKVLARVRVQKFTKDGVWRPGWNYWIAAIWGTDTTAVMVNLDGSGSVKKRPMHKYYKEPHDRPEAKWLQQKSAYAAVAGWTTCDGSDCCCEGPNCGNKGGGGGGTDSLPSGDTTHQH